MEQGAGGNASPFYNKRYFADNLQRLARTNSQNAINSMMVNLGAIRSGGMVGGQSLDEMVEENNVEQQRRRSIHHFGSPAHPGDSDIQGRQMLGFVSPTRSDYSGFNSNASPARHPSTVLPNGGGIAKRRMQSKAAGRRDSDAMVLDTTAPNFGRSSGALTQSPIYQQSLDSDTMNLEMATMQESDLSLNMPYGSDAMEQDSTNNLNIFPDADFEPTLDSLQDQSSLPVSGHPDHSQNAFQNNEQAVLDNMAQMNMMNGVGTLNPSDPILMGLTAQHNENSTPRRSGNANGSTRQDIGNAGSLDFINLRASNRNNMNKVNNFSTSIAGSQQMPRYPNAYSQSGFDMLGVLMRVAARPRPQINIGAVDMSCAFVVCDVSQHDIPIVYCSEMFERLTGYVKHEILGRNCRFLQAPDGKVQAGVERKYVDDKSVYHLKSMITQMQEAQISLINYRKGGQPFMNLLTMIPISWDADEIRYFVGFQVDLVEQPTSITNKNPDGSYSINYQRGLLPRYVVQKTPETNKSQDLESGHTIDRDEVSTVLSTIGTGDSEYSKRIWDKVVIENTDDVVHVLSLKGLFQYLSPSCKKILEYEPHELVGTPLSSVCHPSDIVPVTRELKDTAPGATVNIVFRIRRKHSGYTWFESHGSLHAEQGKGKKCIILCGRERPVYALQRRDIVSEAEIGDSELWTKMSTSGMFLYVSAHAKSLLDRQPEDLVGSSVQALMRADSKEIFNRMLDLARGGKIVTFKHDIQNRRGQTLHAQSTLYPGDASEGQKPTFLIAQTKLLKMSRERASAAALGKSTATEATKSRTPPFTSAAESTATFSTGSQAATYQLQNTQDTIVTAHGGNGLMVGNQHEALASEDNVFDELKTTRSTSWQFELRQMEKRNRVLAEELQSLNSSKKKRKRRKGLGQLQKDCANCHTRSTPEWRRGPSGNRDLCNSCGLRWAKQVEITNAGC